MLKKIFSAKGVKSFFKVRDDNGDFSPQEALATLIQLLMMIGTVFALWKMGLIG